MSVLQCGNLGPRSDAKGQEPPPRFAEGASEVPPIAAAPGVHDPVIVKSVTDLPCGA